MTAATVSMKRKPAAQPDDVFPAAPAVSIPDRMIRDLADVFGMLADKSRLKIVLALLQQGRLHVNALVKVAKQSQPAISHHLRLLRTIGLVDFDRRGKNNFYFIATAHLRDLLERFFGASGSSSLNLDEFSLSFAPRTTH